MTDQRAGASQLHRLLDAVIDLTADLDLPVVLRGLTQAAIDLVGARYGALGVLDTEGPGLADFIAVGIPAEQVEEIGHLPEGHGILGLLIREPRPIRLPDLSQHPDSHGFPPHHPPMTTFLGVPVFVRGAVYGNLYLTEKADGSTFTDADEEIVVGLAAAAGVAIENARLHTTARELDVFKERDRIARDLHDTVVQRLFAIGLTLQGVARLAERPEVVEQIERAVDDLDDTVREVRRSIFELHARQEGTAGLRRQLLSLGDELSAALGTVPTFRFGGPVDAEVSDGMRAEVVAVVREALTNVARHAEASSVDVTVEARAGQLVVHVVDDGVGLGPKRTGGRGIDNMAARASALGGSMDLGSGTDGGTHLTWRVPLR